MEFTEGCDFYLGVFSISSLSQGIRSFDSACQCLVLLRLGKSRIICYSLDFSQNLNGHFKECMIVNSEEARTANRDKSYFRKL